MPEVPEARRSSGGSRSSGSCRAATAAGLAAALTTGSAAASVQMATNAATEVAVPRAASRAQLSQAGAQGAGAALRRSAGGRSAGRWGTGRRKVSRRRLQQQARWRRQQRPHVGARAPQAGVQGAAGPSHLAGVQGAGGEAARSAGRRSVSRRPCSSKPDADGSNGHTSGGAAILAGRTQGPGAHLQECRSGGAAGRWGTGRRKRQWVLAAASPMQTAATATASERSSRRPERRGAGLQTWLIDAVAGTAAAGAQQPGAARGRPALAVSVITLEGQRRQQNTTFHGDTPC